MIIDEIRNRLFDFRDDEYCLFQSKLLPTVRKKDIIGVRTPDLRRLAKELSKKENLNIFLDNLPHRYFEENQLHAFVLAEIRDYRECVTKIDLFLPFVDNWATCDQMLPKIFKRHKRELVCDIGRWIKSKDTYAVRFAINMLKNHFLDDDFDIKYPTMIISVRSNEYYINMMIAWYFATGLAKQYDSILPFILENKLNKWIHNKTIQKAIESNRIEKEKKEYLKSLKKK